MIIVRAVVVCVQVSVSFFIFTGLCENLMVFFLKACIRSYPKLQKFFVNIVVISAGLCFSVIDLFIIYSRYPDIFISSMISLSLLPLLLTSLVKVLIWAAFSRMTTGIPCFASSRMVSAPSGSIQS